MHACMRIYNRINHIITYIHNFRTSDTVWVPEFGANRFQHNLRNLFGPSRPHKCSKNNVSGRRSIRHLWGCLRDWIRLRWSNLISFLILSLQNLSKTDPSLERPPKKTSRPKPKTHPLRAGSWRRKRFVFNCFCHTTYTTDRQA